MKVTNTKFKGLKIIQQKKHGDSRGNLRETFRKKIIKWDKLIFDYATTSKKNVLRGIHGDNKSWKLVTCLYGKIYLVVLNTVSKKWGSIVLSDDNKKMVLIPPTYGNGHCVLSDHAVFMYKWSYEGEYPDVEDQFSISWNDPTFNIDWPVKNPILSQRDEKKH